MSCLKVLNKLEIYRFVLEKKKDTEIMAFIRVYSPIFYMYNLFGCNGYFRNFLQNVINIFIYKQFPIPKKQYSSWKIKTQNTLLPLHCKHILRTTSEVAHKLCWTFCLLNWVLRTHSIQVKRIVDGFQIPIFFQFSN